jgi:diaminopimelate decarboxylase
MTATDLIAEHGSPLWLADVDRVRDNARALRRAFAEHWPATRLAYSYKTNRLAAFLGAVDEEGLAPEVVCEAEYRLAREVVGAPAEAIVVNGPGKPDTLLARAAADGALIVVDSIDELDRVAAAGGQRAGLRVAVDSFGAAPSRFGIEPGAVRQAARRARELGIRVETLSAHLVSMDFASRPDADTPLAQTVVGAWPKPAALHADLAGLLARLARDDVPVGTLDLGGGHPAPAQAGEHARAIAAALHREGYTGDLLLEPGRAVVADAVDLACTVVAFKTLRDGTACAVLDAGTNLVPGSLWGWPRVEPLAVASDGAPGPTLLTGPLCLNIDVIHPAAALPPLRPGDTLLLRAVGAYHQAQSTQFGELRPAVVARDGGSWRLVQPRETLAHLTPAAAATAPASDAPWSSPATSSAAAASPCA